MPSDSPTNGVDDEPTTTAEPTPTSDGENDEEDPEPAPSFTQPYIPGDEPRVIDLPDELPVEPPDGEVSDEEREVLEAAGRFMASWQAILFGADAERAGVRDTTTGEQLDRLMQFITDRDEQSWVFTGDPMELTARSLSVDGDSAEVDVCLVLAEWVEFRGGSVNPYGSPERYLVHLQRVDGAWKTADAQEEDADVCEGS